MMLENNVLSPKESFAPIFDVTQIEVMLAGFGFIAALFSWALFRIRLPKKIGRDVKRRRSRNVNKYFIPILIITPILFLFGMDAMAWTGLIMLMSAAGIKIPYWMPRVGKISIAAESYSNEIASEKSDIGFDLAGEIKGLVNPWISFSRSRRREKIKFKNQQRETIELIQESIFSAKLKIVIELFKTYILFSIIFALLYNILPNLLPDSISSALFGDKTYSFYEILFINYFAYGIIPFFLYLSYKSSSNAIELLKIATINSPKYVNIEDKPKTIKDRFLKQNKRKSSFKQNSQSNLQTRTYQSNPKVPVGRPSLGLPPRPPVVQQPPAIMPPRPPVVQQPPAIMPPRPPVVQQPPAVMPPHPSVVQQSPAAIQPPQSSIQQSPPMPSSGLPPGWTIEQWRYYGNQWIEQNGSNR